MDKTGLDALINQICRLDIEDRDDDEAAATAKSLSDKVQENVQGKYDSVVHDGDQLISDVDDVMEHLKALRDKTKDLTSDEVVKDDANSLLTEETDWVERSDKLMEKLQVDYKTLTNIKEGSLKGANNPRVRAAMEYGKEKHKYNQLMCQEKELPLSSGRPDCVSFQKDNCIVWEFKPDSYTEDEARSQADKYLKDVRNKFKDDPRAKENCKKDSDGMPIFEARGVTYPACSSASFN